VTDGPQKLVPEIQDMPEIQERRNCPRHQTLLGGSGDRSFAGLVRLSPNRLSPNRPSH
jgi:hypothetical protein